jgi:prevent-host-death family protein
VFVPAERNTNHKGNAAELAIAAEAARLGLAVFAPLTEHGRYDLILGVADVLLRVQCKWGRREGDTIMVQLASSYHSPTRGYVTRTYSAAEVDAVAVYCEQISRCYLVPIDLVAGTGRFTLRLAPARNNQQASLNLAAEYEFTGAVAQLEERLTGSQEVTGSSPVSSIARDAAATIEVGAHEFRNRFGYFMERAAAGAEIAVNRRGRPYVRMCGAAFNDPSAAADE